MTGNAPYSEQREQQSRPLWWWLFCMPGAVLMWWEYMFPGRGRVYATGRRYRNRFVQFLYTVLFYGVVAFVCFAVPHKDWDRLLGRTPTAVAATTTAPLAPATPPPALAAPDPVVQDPASANQPSDGAAPIPVPDTAAPVAADPTPSKPTPSDAPVEVLTKDTSLYDIKDGQASPREPLAVGTSVKVLGAYGDGWRHVTLTTSTGDEDGYVPDWALSPAASTSRP